MTSWLSSLPVRKASFGSFQCYSTDAEIQRRKYSMETFPCQHAGAGSHLPQEIFSTHWVQRRKMCALEHTPLSSQFTLPWLGTLIPMLSRLMHTQQCFSSTQGHLWNVKFSRTSPCSASAVGIRPWFLFEHCMGYHCRPTVPDSPAV